MHESEITRLRQKLVSRRDEINALLKLSVESRSVVELDQSSVGRVSRIDAMQAQQMALAAGRQRQEELIRIEAALTRMNDGTYGECLVCGEDMRRVGGLEATGHSEPFRAVIPGDDVAVAVARRDGARRPVRISQHLAALIKKIAVRWFRHGVVPQ